MFPSITTYPKFVPDQLLTSDALNNLFSYVDDQERMTRTNLLGVGIVCGLHIKMNTTGTLLTITKGTGITTQGYLVSIPETTFGKSIGYTIPAGDSYFNDYKAAVAPNNLELWELKQLSSDEATDVLNAGFLADKSVLIYVELVENHNLTCDPNSCDDKGISVAVTLRPLLVKNAQAPHFISAVTNINASEKKYFTSRFVAQNLPEIRMRRFNVPATSLVNAPDIFEAYRSVFQPIITDTKDACTKAYDLFSVMVRQDFATDPFTSLTSTYNFLHNNTASVTQKLHAQYYYDFFYDLQEAYMELREHGLKLLGYCCPEPALFPRHLLLGEVYPATSDEQSVLRHYFMFSPLFEQSDLWTKVRLLFKRLALMVQKFSLPASPGSMQVRITPGPSCNVPLSKKPIPYYYTAKGSTTPFLFKYWNVEKRLQGKPEQVLSYNSGDYNSIDGFITNPLSYEINDCRFLRIEGIIGKPVNPVYNKIKSLIKEKRLPFKVIALRASEFDIEEITSTASEYDIEDLEISYDLARREWEAVIGKTIEYLHDHHHFARSVINEDNNGRYEDFMRKLASGKRFMVDSLPGFIPSYSRFIVLFEDIEARATEIRNDLHNLIVEDYFVYYEQKDVPLVREDEITLTEDMIDHFDDVVMSVKKGPFRALYQEYQTRVTDVYKNLFLKEFLKHHPGIQHRAGVPAGGTFILVYHKTPVSAASSSTNPKSTEHAVFQGKVVDSSGDPIGSALVMFQGTTVSTYTNQEGVFSIETDSLPVTVLAKAAGYSDGRIVRNRADDNMTFTLSASSTTTTSTTEIADDTIIADFYLPYLCCGEGRSVEFVINEAPVPVNEPPVARAGDDITIKLPDNKVTLHGGNSTDPDGEPLEFLWTKVSGPALGTITQPMEAITLANNLAEGVYDFKIKVKDRAGATSEDAVRITVVRDNVLPTANAGDPDIITLPTNFYMLDGSRSSDPDGVITAYLWSKLSGPAAHIVNAALQKTLVDGLVVGNYVFELRVTDNKGGIHTAQKQLIVKPEPRKPIAVAAASKTLVKPGEDIQLDASGSTDPGGNTTTLRYEWKLLEGRAEFHDHNEVKPKVFNITTNSTFQLTVTDNENQTSTDSVKIKVETVSVCLPIAGLIALFDRFGSSNADEFKQFKVSFDKFADIQQFFTRFKAVGTDPAAQLTFFINEKTAQLLLAWLEEIANRADPGKPFFKFYIELYAILINLAMYIACFQPEDVIDPKVKVSMFGVFDRAIKHFDMFQQKGFSADDVKILQSSYASESTRAAATRQTKPEYNKLLDESKNVLGTF